MPYPALHSLAGFPRTPALLVLFFSWCLIVFPAGAQTTDSSSVEETLERTLDALEEDEQDPTPFIDLLTLLAEEPLDLNRARAEDLAMLPGITPRLARAVIAYREQHGPFASVKHLTLVPGMSEAQVRAFQPFLMVREPDKPSFDRSPHPRGPSPAELLRGLRFEFTQRVTRRLERSKGFRERAYVGSPERVFARLRGTYKRHLSINLTMEKDPGERWTWRPSVGAYGFDYVSMHLALRDYGRLQTLILGDYEAAFGQGLVLWRGFSPGKGRAPISPAHRVGMGLRPYASAEENRFFRGVAATVRITPHLSLSGFISRRSLDARLTRAKVDSSREGITGRLVRTGLHRTPTELARKDALKESLWGAHLSLRRGAARLGITGYRTTFSRPLAPDSAAYERFAFRGRDASLLSLDGSLLLGSLTLFGEVAGNLNDRPARYGGVLFEPAPGTQLILTARSYPRDFPTLHSHAFGEGNGEPRNESGMYLGARLHPHPDWTLAAFFDLYRFPWLRFGVDRPSRGHEVLGQLSYHPRTWLDVYVLARSETKEAGLPLPDSAGRQLDAVGAESRHSLRLQGEYHFNRDLRLRARVEGVRHHAADGTPSHGLLLFQDIRWRAIPSLQVHTRLLFFDVDVYGARVFTYEDDLRYTFSVPSFTGRGQRFYILLSARPVPSVSFQIKYAVTRFEDTEVIGTGMDEIPGDRLREIRLQLQWRL